MSRSTVQVRDAVPEDADALCALWEDLLSRTTVEHRGSPGREEAAASIARLAASAERRLVVADLGGAVVGAALLVRAPVSPLHEEDAVHVSHLHVSPDHRRHGVGRLLLDAAVGWAEEKGSSTLLVAAAVSDRDANRFLARQGLAPVAVLRAAPAALLRQRRSAPGSRRHVGQVLARRRSQRRLTPPSTASQESLGTDVEAPDAEGLRGPVAG